MRKTTHYILLLLAALTAQTTVMRAQSSRAIGEAFLQTLLEARNIQQNADSLESHLIEKYRKDPAVLTEIGRAYYRTGEADRARNIYDKVLNINPKFARALVGCGDIFRYKNNNALKFGDYSITSEAYQAHQDSAHYYYMKAIEAEPGNQLPYDSIMVLFNENRERYYTKNTHEDSIKAMDTYIASIALLNQLKENNPTVSVEPDIARTYLLMDEYAKALEIFQPMLDKLTPAQYYNYCYCLWGVKKFDEAIAEAQAGLEQFPDNKMLHRIIMYSYYSKEQYKKASQAYVSLYESEHTLFARDHLWAGDCYLWLNNPSEATRVFNRICDVKDGGAIAAFLMVKDYIDSIVTVYKKEGDYEAAIGVYRDYMNERDYDKVVNFYRTRTNQSNKTKDELLSVDMYNWALEYWYKAKEDKNILGLQKTDDERLADYIQCDSAFAIIQDRFPEYRKDFIIYIRATTLTPVDVAEQYVHSRALPYHERMVFLYENGETTESRVEDSYKYLAYYWFIVKKNMSKARPYAIKFKEIHPEVTYFDEVIKNKSSRRRR